MKIYLLKNKEHTWATFYSLEELKTHFKARKYMLYKVYGKYNWRIEVYEITQTLKLKEIGL